MHTSFSDSDILGKFSDEGYMNKFPEDAAAMAALVRQADLQTAVSLLQVWGSKQRDLGSLKALEILRTRTNNIAGARP
jgi:hypothetical protein